MTPKFEKSKKHRLASYLKVAGRKMLGISRVTGLLLSVISMHLLIIRPLVTRVDQLQSELQNIEDTLERVASEQSSLESTNDLLSGLRIQHDEIAGARATLWQIQKLREEMESESSRIPAALKAISRISKLPDHLHKAELDSYSALKPASVDISVTTNLSALENRSADDGKENFIEKSSCTGNLRREHRPVSGLIPIDRISLVPLKAIKLRVPEDSILIAPHTQRGDKPILHDSLPVPIKISARPTSLSDK